MLHSMKVFLTLIPVIVIIDYIWLARIMSTFYRTELDHLVRKQGDALAPILWAAGIVYICIPLGIVLFVLPRVSQENILLSSLSWGFIFGIVLYGVYDMTNQSLLRNWPLKVTFVDILWGGSLCAFSSYIGALLDRWYA
jgi:uncharacterized membrane protein